MDSFITSIRPTLQPTFVGHVANLEDALLIVEACLSGILYHISRFPRQHELQDLIGSGNTFVYAELPTGKGNWDHGKDWMVLGREDGVLVQRETFGPDGFFLKSGSFVVRGMAHNFVSYDKVGDIVRSCSKEGDVLNEILKRPFQVPRLKGISLRPELASLLPNPSMEAAEALSGDESGAGNRKEAAGEDEDDYNTRKR